MRRIKLWILRLSIKQKLIFYSYLIITPILLLISALIFLKSYKSTILTQNESHLQSVQSLSDSLGVLQKNIMEFGTYICINTDINQILTTDEPEKLNTDSQLWVHKAPMRIIEDIVGINGQLKTVAIYPENGVKPYLRCMDASSYVTNIATVRETDTYRLALDKNGKPIWKRVTKVDRDTYIANYNDKIVMYREILDLSKKNKLGYLVIGASIDKFENACNNSLQVEGEGIAVISAEGAELIRCGVIEDTVLSQILKENNKTIKKAAFKNYNNHTVFFDQNEDTGTIVYKIVPKAGLRENLYMIAYTPAALLLGFLVGLCPILIFVSNIVSKPLKQLCVAMQKFKQGDFSQSVEVNTLDEVGEVATCFNQMVDDIKKLIDKNYVIALKEKESELNALQAQINPHFLYNTLDSLYWQATDAGNEEIAEDIYALSQLFRLVLGQGKGIVAVRNEQELIDRYLHIQKMRFEKQLDYSIDMEEEILDMEIPKLILQPFVENAIGHGFVKTGEKCYISVTGRKKGIWVEFCIQDNGIGMSREQLAAIWNIEDSKRYQSQRIGRYAIKNVKERLELMYHEKFKLLIESEEGIGTTVIIEIPFCNERVG